MCLRSPEFLDEARTDAHRVPAVAASLLHSSDLPKERDFATVFYGGAPPSKQLAAEVKQRWPKAAMYVSSHAIGGRYSSELMEQCTRVRYDRN